MAFAFLRPTFSGLPLLLLVLLSGFSHASTVSVYFSPPKVQESSGTDFLVETFNQHKVGALDDVYHLSIGFIENPNATAKVEPGSITGGARLSNYLMGGPFEIKLTYPTNYLGFWWATVDADNIIELYDVSHNLILRLTGAQISEFLSNSPNIVGGDGVGYASEIYKGNPSFNKNEAAVKNKPSSSQNYLFCNIYLDGPERINSIIIRDGLFEVDNISVSLRNIEPDTSMIPVFSSKY
jgi:hypothetical protein